MKWTHIATWIVAGLVWRPAVAKPPSGPALNDQPVQQQQPREKTATEMEEEKQQLLRNRLIEAQDKADLLRAAYEKKYRPGKVTDEAMHEQVVQAYRKAIELDARGEIGTYCRLRLSGAYTFVGNPAGGLAVLNEAINSAVGPGEQLRCSLEAANHCLQAMHDADAAMRYYERARVMLEKHQGQDEMIAKYATAIHQGMTRCEEMRKEKAMKK